MLRFSACLAALGALILSDMLAAGPLGSTFTYQGQLQTAGEPTTDDCDFRFTPFAVETGGDPVGIQAEQIAQPVVEGVFTLNLDFGPEVFDGQNRWLAIEVRCPTAIGNYQLLSPRQPITPAPYAIRALNGSGAFELDGGNAVFLGGNVGIGTSSPTSILHLNDNAPAIGIRLKTMSSWTAELRQTESSVLSLINGGTERFSITAGGRFGFNTTSPQAVLHAIGNLDPGLRLEPSSDSGEDTGIEIVGARNASTNTDVAFVDLRDFDSNEGAGTEFSMARIAAGMQDVSGQTGFLRFYTNAGADLQERMRIDKLGSVSIGSESGTERLKVAGDVAIGGGTAIGLHDGNSEYLRIRGRVDDWYLGVRDAPTAPEHDFFIGLSDQDFTRFNFDRSGNLGLGTEPAADLHLASTGSQQIRVDADTDNSGESDQPSVVLTQDGGQIAGAFGFFGGSNDLSVSVSNGGGGVSNLLLEPDGLVGLGTGSPQNMLDVQGQGTSVGGVSGINDVITRFRQTTANTSTAISIDAQSSENAILYFSKSGQAWWSIRSTEDADLTTENVLNIRYHDPAGSSATNLLTLSKAEITPGADNSVSLGRFGLSGVSPRRAFQDVVSYAVTILSDRRLKRDIQPLDYGIEEVMQLEPVRFHWRSGTDDSERLGVIAQDVYDVIPETVVGNPDREEGSLGVRYSELIPVLIRGMQDQQVQIEVLVEENADLRERLSTLESLLPD